MYRIIPLALKCMLTCGPKSVKKALTVSNSYFSCLRSFRGHFTKLPKEFCFIIKN